MGTRHLTYVYDETDTILLCMYGQWDGYISGHGTNLANFLNSFDAIVNGIPVGDPRKMANGMGCLAAQLVAHFKDGAGNFYIYPPKLGNDCWQEYEYHIRPKSVTISGGAEFSGTWKQFAEYCTEKVSA
jgi:hypothetical protein